MRNSLHSTPPAAAIKIHSVAAGLHGGSVNVTSVAEARADARLDRGSEMRSSTGSSFPVSVAKKYKVGRKIGSGSFGEIHLGTDAMTGDNLAIKFEPLRSRHPQLLYEAKLYRVLSGGVGIPIVHWYGVEDSYSVMVLDLLGPSLEDLFNFSHRQFSLKTVLMLADQMINRVEYCHAKSILHRDIKPDNFLVGVGAKSTQVHIIDFGLAKRFRDPKTQQHIPYREKKSLTGTARYASVNTHLGVEQSRRDDLEAVGYVLMYFLRGSLPWQGLKARSKREKYEAICRTKVETSPSTLCKNHPSEFVTYLTYCRNLGFEDPPDYNHLRQLLKDLFVRSGYKHDLAFDWSPSSGVVDRRAGTPPPERRVAARSPLPERAAVPQRSGEASRELTRGGTLVAASEVAQWPADASGMALPRPRAREPLAWATAGAGEVSPKARLLREASPKTTRFGSGSMTPHTLFAASSPFGASQQPGGGSPLHEVGASPAKTLSQLMAALGEPSHRLSERTHKLGELGVPRLGQPPRLSGYGIGK